MSLSYGSICSGVEAATLAWAELGFRAAWFSEIEPFPCAVLAQRWPHVPNHGDMTLLADKILAGAIPAPDILVGGTPCQAFSVAGLRGSLNDTRGNLTLELIRIIHATDLVRRRNGKPPCLLVWENVPGVLNTRDNAFGCFLGGLAGEDCPLVPSGQRWTDAGCVLGHQRRIAWRVLDAQYFGVPQRRRRVFVVASAGAHDPAEILFERNGVRGHFGAGGTARESASAYVESGFGGYRELPVAGTVRAAGGAVSGGSESLIVANGRQTPVTTVNIAQPVDTYAQTNVIAATLTTGHGIQDDQIANGNCVIGQHFVRRLTPLECERLQGMPDHHTRIAWRGKPAEECPDTPRYKAIGNSMAVNVMRWIGRRIRLSTQTPKDQP